MRGKREGNERVCEREMRGCVVCQKEARGCVRGK